MKRLYELFNNVSKSPTKKYEKHKETFTVHFFDDIKHFEIWQRLRYVQTYKV